MSDFAEEMQNIKKYLLSDCALKKNCEIRTGTQTQIWITIHQVSLKVLEPKYLTSIGTKFGEKNCVEKLSFKKNTFELK